MSTAGREETILASQASANYEPPALTVLGGVEELTQIRLKKYGCCDGYDYHGTDITDAST